MTKELQTFLNWYIDAGLVVDGVHGNLTRKAEQTALQQLRTDFKEKNLNFDNKFNFIGIRTEMVVSNKFNDWFIVTLGNTLALAVPASTKAGLPAIWKYAYRKIRGYKGFGTIVGDQEIDYQLVIPNKNNAWSMWAGGTGFLFQDKPINIYRDQNLDNIIDTDTLVNKDLGGAFNVHSWAGWRSPFVQNLSEGCQVTKIQYWRVLFPLLVANNEKGRILYKIITKIKN